MKNLPLLMCTAFCGLNAVQADAADNCPTLAPTTANPI